MILPNDITEEEFIEALTRVNKKIRKKYSKCEIDIDDLTQETFFLAAEVCKKYKRETGPLVNFLFISVDNRVKNLLRKYRNHNTSAISMTDANEEFLYIIDYDARCDEIWALIDDQLPAVYREDYLRIKQGISVPRIRREKIISIIKGIIDEFL